jgi:histidyl-tRNA synthetase
VRFQVVKGTRDILPEETTKWQYIERTTVRILETFGYREIRTPTFESTGLFTRSIGETTDIVEKEMYSFEDRKRRKISLRPEGTAPIIRACIEHGVSPPVRLYYSGSMFRYERPQRGRSREFYQIGIEAVGSISPLLDAEVIDVGDYLLRQLGLRDVEISLNSIGCRKCRTPYRKVLSEYIEKKRGDLCEMCQERIARNPFRILDCKDAACQRIAAEAPSMSDSLCSDCSQHFESVKTYLRELKIAYQVDPRLFRGLDYYTKTTFEFTSKTLGAKDTILGGGRYDYLVSELGGKDTPAIGWAFGVDRLILALETEGFQFPILTPKTVFVAWTSDATREKSLEITRMLRREGIPSQMDYDKRKLRSQLNIANRLGADYTIIVGDEELRGEKVILRDMATGAQNELPIDKLQERLKKLVERC